MKAHYNPPENKDVKEAYDLGYQAYKDGKSDSDNPYIPSGHERNTTIDDERNFQWYCGFWDSEDDDKNNCL